jgi:hypothetical protein
VLVHRLDQLLARTDPFDLAQALERYVRGMSPERIRSVIIDARDRMGAYYRTEFVRLLQDSGGIRHVDMNDLSGDRFVKIVHQARTDDALKNAFSRLLKSNLRAIPVFGAPFAEGILESVPVDRAVAIGEEAPKSGTRAALFAGIAVALVLAGAAGEHVIANVRAQNTATPLPVIQPPLVSIVSPRPAAQTAPPRRAAVVADNVAERTRRTIVVPAKPRAAPATERTVASATPAPPAATAPPQAAPAAVSSSEQPGRAVVQPVQAARTLAIRASSAPRTPRPAAGVATVVIPDPTPTAEPSAIDVSDMPDAISQGTPLPQVTAPQAEAPRKIALKTPEPKKPRGLIKKTLKFLGKTLYHLDPFKPHP